MKTGNLKACPTGTHTKGKAVLLLQSRKKGKKRTILAAQGSLLLYQANHKWRAMLASTMASTKISPTKIFASVCRHERTGLWALMPNSLARRQTKAPG